MKLRSLLCIVCEKAIHALLMFLPCVNPRWLSLKRSSYFVYGYRLTALFFIFFSLVSFLSVSREITSYESVRGVVTRLISKQEDVCLNSDVMPSGPECIEERYIVEFQTKAGLQIEATFIAAGKNAVPELGNKLLIGYDPSDPKGTAMNYGALEWSFMFGWIIGACGISMLLLDWIGHHFFQKRRGRRKPNTENHISGIEV